VLGALSCSFWFVYTSCTNLLGLDRFANVVAGQSHWTEVNRLRIYLVLVYLYALGWFGAQLTPWLDYEYLTEGPLWDFGLQYADWANWAEFINDIVTTTFNIFWYMCVCIKLAVEVKPILLFGEIQFITEISVLSNKKQLHLATESQKRFQGGSAVVCDLWHADNVRSMLQCHTVPVRPDLEHVHCKHDFVDWLWTGHCPGFHD